MVRKIVPIYTASRCICHKNSTSSPFLIYSTEMNIAVSVKLLKDAPVYTLGLELVITLQMPQRLSAQGHKQTKSGLKSCSHQIPLDLSNPVIVLRTGDVIQNDRRKSEKSRNLSSFGHVIHRCGRYPESYTSQTIGYTYAYTYKYYDQYPDDHRPDEWIKLHQGSCVCGPGNENTICVYD